MTTENAQWGRTARLMQKLHDQEDERGQLNPGEEGYWQSWGARAIDIRPGDLDECQGGRTR